MSKNKILLIFAIVISIYIVFAVLVLIIFNSISNNPIDIVSINYIRNNADDIQNRYGEIIHIGKNILYKTEKTPTSVKSPYTIETENGRVIAYVYLMKYDDIWKAVSLEIIEVISNE